MTQGTKAVLPSRLVKCQPRVYAEFTYTATIYTCLLFLLPLSSVGVRGISIGVVAAAFLSVPMALRTVRFSGSRALLLMWVVALACGPLLAQMSVQDGYRVLDSNLELRILAIFATGGLTLAALLSGRAVLGVRRTALAYGLGTLAQVLADPAAWSDNPWKYAFSWPVAIVLLALSRRTMLVLAGLVAVSVQFDFRSFAGLCVIAAVLVLWRRRSKVGRRKARWPLLGTLLLVVLVYEGASWLALSGQLGASIQERSVAQTRAEQSLLFGSRPEWVAAVDLAKARPVGFGPGVRPAASEVGIAKTALASLGRNTESEYVERYLFGTHVELHSVASDMWVNFGPLGLLLAALMGWRIVTALGDALSRGGLSGLWALVALVGLWDLAFSPMGSSLMRVVFAVALALPIRDPAKESDRSHKASRPMMDNSADVRCSIWARLRASCSGDTRTPSLADHDALLFSTNAKASSSIPMKD